MKEFKFHREKFADDSEIEALKEKSLADLRSVSAARASLIDSN